MVEFHTVATKEDFEEMGRASLEFAGKKGRRQKPWRRLWLLAGAGALLFAVYLFLPLPATAFGQGVRTLLRILFVAEAVLLVVYTLALSMWGRIYKKAFITAQKNNTLASIIAIDEAGITTKAENGSQSHFFEWGTLERLLETPNLYFFKSRNGIAVFFGKRFVPAEQAAPLQALIAEKMAGRHLEWTDDGQPT